MLKYFVIVVIASAGLLAWWFLTGFDRSLKEISNKITDVDIQNIAPSLTEITSDDLNSALYIYDANKYGIPGRIESNRVANVVNDGGLPFVKSGGIVFVIVHKWKNFSAGIACDVAGNGVSNSGEKLLFTPIHDRRYIWKLNLER
jgi:hypothetical protein